MDKFTEFIKIILGGIVTAVSGFFGGMDGIMFALIAFISIDYVTGVAVAVKQKKLSSEGGGILGSGAQGLHRGAGRRVTFC